MSDTTGARAVETLMNKEKLADVVIKLDDGTMILAHRTILSARCIYLRRQLGISTEAQQI